MIYVKSGGARWVISTKRNAETGTPSEDLERMQCWICLLGRVGVEQENVVG